MACSASQHHVQFRLHQLVAGLSGPIIWTTLNLSFSNCEIPYHDLALRAVLKLSEISMHIL